MAELVAVGKPSVLIPLVPAAGDEQRGNARHLVGAGAARALLEPDPAPQQLLAELDELLSDPGLRVRMTDAAKALGRPDAANALAKVILDQCRGDQRCRLLAPCVEAIYRSGPVDAVGTGKTAGRMARTSWNSG